MSESDESTENYEVEDQPQLAFVRILKENRVVLNKSQLPNVKAKKTVAIKNIIDAFYQQYAQRLDEKQVYKKINNMKTKVKIKSDARRTGNKRIKLAKWEQLFLNILQEEDNPAITLIPGACAAGFSDSQNAGSEGSQSTDNSIPLLIPPPKPAIKRKKEVVPELETYETRKLSTGELQRLVLLEQLALTRLQTRYYSKKMEKLEHPSSLGTTETVLEGDKLFAVLH